MGNRKFLGVGQSIRGRLADLKIVFYIANGKELVCAEGDIAGVGCVAHYCHPFWFRKTKAPNRLFTCKALKSL